MELNRLNDTTINVIKISTGQLDSDTYGILKINDEIITYTEKPHHHSLVVLEGLVDYLIQTENKPEELVFSHHCRNS